MKANAQCRPHTQYDDHVFGVWNDIGEGAALRECVLCGRIEHGASTAVQIWASLILGALTFAIVGVVAWSAC